MVQQMGVHNSPQQPQPNGDQSETSEEEETNSPQFSWITDTIVINGNPVRVIFPNQEESN